MKIDKAKVEYFLNELKKRGKPMSGGVGRPSYELRDPKYYWDFGKFLVEQAQQVDEDERDRWIIRQTKNIEKEILGPVSNDDWLTHKIYCYVNELEDEEHFMYIANLAGHKFKKFRLKVVGYIFEIFSKKNTEYSEVKKNKLSEKLLEKLLTHDEINKALKEFRGKGKNTLGYGIKNSFDILSSKVEDAVNTGSSNDRVKLKNEIGKNMIDKLRTYLQILPLNDSSLFEEMVSEYKKQLNRNISTNNNDAKKLDEAFGKCIKDKDLKKKIMTLINAYDMGQTNTFLNAIESESDYDEWKRTKENFAQMSM